MKIITTTEILNNPINCSVEFKNEKDKYGKLELNGETDFYIKFRNEVCMMDAKTMYGTYLAFENTSEIGKVITSIEDHLDQQNHHVNKHVKKDKILVFIPFLESAQVAKRGEKKSVKPDTIKKDAIHTGFMKIKWVYKDLSDQSISIKFVVAATKFENPKEEDLLALL